MAKNTGIERSKKNPIEIGKRGKVAYLAFQSIRIKIQCILKKMTFSAFHYLTLSVRCEELDAYIN